MVRYNFQQYIHIFGNLQQFWHYCIYESYIKHEMSAYQFYSKQYLCNKNVINNSNIYVSIYVSILKLVYISMEWNISQYSMLDNHENIYIQKYDQ